MMNIQYILQYLKHNKYNDIYESQIYAIAKEVDDLWLKIKKCDGVASADVYLNRLEELQEFLSTFPFKYKVPLPRNINNIDILLYNLNIANDKFFVFYAIKDGIDIYHIPKIEREEHGYGRYFILNGMHIIERKVNRIMWLIKDCKNLKEANCHYYFEDLSGCWSMIYHLSRTETPINEKLEQFAYEFDDFDSAEENRQWMFDLIKSDKYLLD